MAKRKYTTQEWQRQLESAADIYLAERVTAAFNAFPLPVDPASEEEIARRTRERLRSELGLPDDILDMLGSPDDAGEFVGPDGRTEGGGTPPLSARECVQRVLVSLEYRARKSPRDGKSRTVAKLQSGTKTQRRPEDRALQFIKNGWPEWQTMELTKKLLKYWARTLKTRGVENIKPETLRKRIYRARRP